VKKFLIEEMTHQEIVEAVKEIDTVIVLLGTVEQHGPHLPVGTDTLIPITIAKRVAEKTRVLVAPPIYYGNSLSMADMKGVFTITPDSLATLLFDLCRSFAKQGFKKIVFLNGHGGNKQVLSYIGQRARIETGALITRIDWWDIVAEEMSKICKKAVQHADEGETSMMLACRPELVDMKKATKDDTSDKLTDALIGKPKNLPQVFVSFTKWSKTGLIGDATKASKGKGEKIMKAVVNNIVSFLQQIDKLEGKLTE
jgi:creatinine amidohydrolase